MTPVMQMALIGLIWALSVSIIMIVSTFVTCWLMKIVDDRKAIEVEEYLARLKVASTIQNGREEVDLHESDKA